MFVKHPETGAAVYEGSMKEFICKVKACYPCSYRWLAQELHPGAKLYHPQNYKTEDVGQGFKRSTLHMLAVNSTVVQCERRNKITGKRYYSKFAFLHVIKSQQGMGF